MIMQLRSEKRETGCWLVLSKTSRINTTFNKLYALAVIYTVKNLRLASRWDSNQALKKPTGTALPSLTKLAQCHAAQTFRND